MAKVTGMRRGARMGLVESISSRRDVLDGELTEARFAASLEEVVAGAATESLTVY
jgi:hypothetical protein